MTQDEKKCMELSCTLDVMPCNIQDLCESALEAIDIEAVDALCYNGLYGKAGCFDGHRYIKQLEAVGDAVVCRVFIQTYFRFDNPDGYRRDDDGELILDENGEAIDEWDTDDIDPGIYDCVDESQFEVAQFWMLPNGQRVTLAVSRDQERRFIDVNDLWSIDTPLLPAKFEDCKDILTDNYRCYDEDDYEVMAEMPNVNMVAYEMLGNFVHEYADGFEKLRSRIDDQMSACFKHWGLSTIYANYMNQGIKSAAARHFHTIKIAIRNKFQPNDEGKWLNLLDTIELCKGNIQDPRNYMPVNFDEMYDYWMQRNEKRLDKIEREAERKRIEEAERRYMENIEQVRKDDAEYLNDKLPFLAVRFDTETMEFHVLQNVREFFEEGVAQGHCVFNNKYYKMPDYIVMSCTDKATGKRLSTVTVDVKEQRLVANLSKKNHVPRNEKLIAETVMTHMPLFVQANEERMQRNPDRIDDPEMIARQESEARINAQMAGARQREREQMALEENNELAIAI